MNHSRRYRGGGVSEAVCTRAAVAIARRFAHLAAVTARFPLLLPLAALIALAACRAPAPDAKTPTVVATTLSKTGQSRLAGAIDALFADRRAGDTQAIVVVRDGRVIAERYGAGIDARTPRSGGSLAKCVTGLLVGLLVADGRLELDAPAPVPAWRRIGDPRGAITPRMLLQMRSGLRHAEIGADGDAAYMLHGDARGDMAAYAEGQPMAARAGSASNYSSADTIVLADLVARTLAPDAGPTARRRAVADYLRTRLFVPASLGSMTAGFDRSGTMIGSTAIWASPRDWGRLGELLRNGGTVRGAQLLPRQWIAFMRRASPVDPEMGAQLWRNHARADGDGLLIAGKAPPGIFACAGKGGQFVIVSPAQRVTLVRLGASGDGGSGVLARRMDAILRALPVDRRSR